MNDGFWEDREWKEHVKMGAEEIEALRRERDEWKAKAKAVVSHCMIHNTFPADGEPCWQCVYRLDHPDFEPWKAKLDARAQLAIAVEALTEICKWWDRGDPVGRDPLAIARETLAKLKEAGHE